MNVDDTGSNRELLGQTKKMKIHQGAITHEMCCLAPQYSCYFWLRAWGQSVQEITLLSWLETFLEAFIEYTTVSKVIRNNDLENKISFWIWSTFLSIVPRFWVPALLKNSLFGPLSNILQHPFLAYMRTLSRALGRPENLGGGGVVDVFR